MEKSEGDTDMELDFHIQFPTPGPVANGFSSPSADTGPEGHLEKIWPIPGCEGKDLTASGEEHEKEIVVVLLGWAGSNHKFLSKYSDLYLKRGCIVLRYITPVKVLFVDTARIPLLAHRLVRLLHEMQLTSHPVFFHVMSNGGSFTYSYILREFLVRPKSEFNIVGTICDSCPAPRNLGKCFVAVSSIFEKRTIFRYFIASLVVFMLILQVLWYHAKSAVKLCLHGESIESLMPEKNEEEAPLKNWLARVCKMKNHHYLFLYSDNDHLIPDSQIEQIAEVAERRGNFVVKKKFLGSEHVKHYRKYPEEYIESVVTFIRHAMKHKRGNTEYWED